MADPFTCTASIHSDRPVLMYLPGLDGSGKLLYRQVALHATYLVECMSYPQDRPQTYAELAQAAAHRLEQAGGGRPGVVLAESFGGGVALTLALTRPELIDRMVLVNAFAYYPARASLKLLAWLGAHLPARRSHPATRRLRETILFSPDLTARDRARFWARTANVPLRAMGLRLRLIERLDLRGRLAEIQIPTLVLTAPNDRLVPPSAGREIARRMPRARLIEMSVGHVALIHPRVDVARLLADLHNWEPFVTCECRT